MDGELTIALLREIRDEIRSTNTRVDRMETSLGARIDGLGTSLGARIDMTNVRLDAVEHVVRDLAEQMLTVSRYVKNVGSRQDDAIEELDARVTRLEQRKA